MALLVLDQIHVSPEAVQEVQETELRELCDLIRRHGITQPVEVVKVGRGRYRLIFGEAAYLAASIVGLERVPAVLRRRYGQELVGRSGAPGPDGDMEQLNQLDRLAAYRREVDRAGNVERAARAIGIHKKSLARALRRGLRHEASSAIAEHVSIPQVTRRLDRLTVGATVRWRPATRDELIRACRRFLDRWDVDVLSDPEENPEP